MQNDGLNSHFPYRIKHWRTTIWKSTGISKQAGVLGINFHVETKSPRFWKECQTAGIFVGALSVRAFAERENHKETPEPHENADCHLTIVWF
jgi:hypothetical protein